MMVVVMVVILLIVLFLIVVLIKNENTYIQHGKIMDAIDDFAYSTGNFWTAMMYMDSMEDYQKTLFRLWDWGCTRIVPKDVYNEIKPYIRKKGKKSK